MISTAGNVASGIGGNALSGAAIGLPAIMGLFKLWGQKENTAETFRKMGIQMPNMTPGNNIISTGSAGNPTVDRILEQLRMGIPTLGSGIGGGASSSSGASGMDWMKWLLPILGGVAGGLDNRAQKVNSTVTPTIDPAVSGLRDKTVAEFMKTFADTDLSGYTTSGVDDINRSADIQKRLAEETMGARGLSGEAVGTAINSTDAARFAAINKFKAGIPLIQQQLKQNAVANAGGFVNSSPRTVNTQSEQSGNVAGGIVGGTSEILAYLYGLGKI